MKHLTLKLLAATGLLVVFAPTAYAGGPLANCQSGQPFTWANGGQNIPFNPDQGDLGPVAAAAAVALVEAGFQAWEDVPTSNATYANAGQLPVDVDITNFGPFLNAVAPDGLSAIVFDDDGQIFDVLFGPGSGILGFAGPEWVAPATCEITEGLSFLNGPAFTDLTAALDVMVHEYGHYSNLAHTVVNGQQFIGAGDTSGPGPNNTFGSPDPFGETIETMYPFYFGPAVGTRTLHLDDQASLSTLYPEPNFSTDTGSISGTIYAPNGTTRLTGVNVIARNLANPFLDASSAISSDFTDSTSQADPVVGTYTIEGLTPGADYAVYVDEVLAGGFSTTLASPLIGPEEFHNGAGEASTGDDPSVFTPVNVSAGSDAAGTDVIFNTPAPGDPLAVGIDGFVELALPFTYQFCGVDYDSVFVNANGNLTFGASSGDFTESAGEMLSGPPRIAALWDDFNPSASGTVFYGQTDNSFTVVYDQVPEFFNTGSNSFEIELKRSSDHINVTYGDLSATDGLAGVSCGGADTSGFETPFDVSSAFPDRINLQRQPAMYEQFGGSNPNDLANSVVGYTGSTDYNDKWAENNDSPAKARRIKLPFDSRDVVRFTEIDPTGGDVDFYRFRADAGTTLIADIQTGALDTVMGLFDSSGVPIAIDDDGGPGLLSRIIAPIPAKGDYYLAVSAFPDFGFTGEGGSGGRYVLDMQSIDGTVLALGDDDTVEVPLDFTFNYQGQDWNSVWVNSNGNLTFGGGDTDFSESVFDLLSDNPRVAGLWDDLSPNQGGLVLAEGDASGLSVAFIGVPEFFSSSGNSFTMNLAADGSVSVSYDGIAAADGIVGVTEGEGAADPGATDLSAAVSLSANGTTYEQFTFGSPFDLEGLALSFDP